MGAYFRFSKLLLVSLISCYTADLAQFCLDREINVVYVLDGSGSVGAANFEVAVDLVKAITSYLDLHGWASSNLGAEVALEQYSTNYYYELGQRFYGDLDDFNKEIDKMRYRTGGTHTKEAIEFVQSNIFPTIPIHRVNYSTAVIVLTDGEATSGDPGPAADVLRRDNNTYFFSVGVGVDANTTQLIGIANEPAAYYVYDAAWSFLGTDEGKAKIAQEIASHVCSATSCTCFNGTAAVGPEECPNDQVERCTECYLGNKMTSDYTCQFDPEHEEIKEETYETSMTATQTYLKDFANPKSAEFKKLEQKMADTYQRVLGTYYKILKLLSVTQQNRLTEGQRGLQAADDQLLCVYNISMQGYESDNLPEIYNEKIDENESVFEYMAYNVTDRLYVPCDDAQCAAGELCVNMPDNVNFVCESSSSYMLGMSVLLIAVLNFL